MWAQKTRLICRDHVRSRFSWGNRDRSNSREETRYDCKFAFHLGERGVVQAETVIAVAVAATVTVIDIIVTSLFFALHA